MKQLKARWILEPGVSAPAYATSESAGCDVRAYIKEAVVLEPGTRKLIPTGIKLDLPSGVVCMVCSRSGLALKHGVMVMNAPGIIDSDYQGEVGVILCNEGSEPYKIEPGERVCQFVFTDSVVQMDMEEAEEFSRETERGAGGFGHTGKQ